MARKMAHKDIEIKNSSSDVESMCGINRLQLRAIAVFHIGQLQGDRCDGGTTAPH